MSKNIDMFQLLLEDSNKKNRGKRGQLLQSMGVKEFFIDGDIKIDKKTCKGVECKLCIDVCPTNALFWKSGEVGIVKELCVYCLACVWSCIVDDCIQVQRKRSNGKMEKVSTPKKVLLTIKRINTKKRRERVEDTFQGKNI
jgi:Fe-S-cluster-containing dehydrogenase component